MKELNSKNLEEAVDYVDSWLEINFANERIPGLQVAIQHKDKLIYSRAFGYANLETKEKLTKDHIFRIASHSKTFTATAIMQLVEAGKVNLDDELSKHVSWFKSTKDKRVSQVTIRQILNHTAGLLRDGLDADYWQALRSFPTIDELKENITESKLVQDSDTGFKYSNLGFGYLGLLIESVSNVTYKEYIIKHIIEKLDLESTSPDLDNKVRKDLSTGYSIEQFNQKRRSFDQIDTRGLAPATGFCSTAEDLCKYFSAHFLGNNTLLNDKAKRQMQHGYWEQDAGDSSYGLGLVDYRKEDWHIYGHGGSMPGFITNTQFDANKKLVVSVLTNDDEGPAKLICRQIINIINTFQSEFNNNPREKYNLMKFEGRFFPIWGVTDITVIGERIFATYPLYWSDFSKADELSVIDGNTLKFVKTNGSSLIGEKVKYTFNKEGKSESIVYGGITMWPYEIAKEKCCLEGLKK